VFLCSPAVRERAGKAADGEIGWCAAVSDGFDDARRHEGERGEVSDVALDLVLASGDLLELQSGILHLARCGDVNSLMCQDNAPRRCQISRELARYEYARDWSPNETPILTASAALPAYPS
jgi:hypothetical protein